jgi:hypothetical protein
VRQSSCHQGASTYLPFQKEGNLIRKNQLSFQNTKVARLHPNLHPVPPDTFAKPTRKFELIIASPQQMRSRCERADNTDYVFRGGERASCSRKRSLVRKKVMFANSGSTGICKRSTGLYWKLLFLWHSFYLSKSGCAIRFFSRRARSLTLRTAIALALALFSLYGRPQSRLVIYR